MLCISIVTYRLLHIDCYISIVTYRLLHIDCYISIVTYRLLHIDCCISIVAYRLLHIDCCTSVVACRFPYVLLCSQHPPPAPTEEAAGQYHQPQQQPYQQQPGNGTTSPPGTRGAGTGAGAGIALQLQPQALPSLLSSEELFQCANFSVLRRLLTQLFAITDDYQSFLSRFSRTHRRQQQPSSGSAPAHTRSIPPNPAAEFVAQTVRSNEEVQLAFYSFWSELVLRALPQSLQHFPAQRVLACDLRAVLTELLSTVAADEQAGPSCGSGGGGGGGGLRGGGLDAAVAVGGVPESTSETRRPSPSSCFSPSATAGGVVCSLGEVAASGFGCGELPSAATAGLPEAVRLQRLPFPAFLGQVQLALAERAEDSLAHAFLKEVVADVSPVLVDLLARHGHILCQWRL